MGLDVIVLVPCENQSFKTNLIYPNPQKLPIPACHTIFLVECNGYIIIKGMLPTENGLVVVFVVVNAVATMAALFLWTEGSIPFSFYARND